MENLVAIRKQYYFVLDLIGVGTHEKPHLKQLQWLLLAVNLSCLATVITSTFVKTLFMDMEFLLRVHLSLNAVAILLTSVFVAFCIFKNKVLEDCLEWCESLEPDDCEPAKRVFEECGEQTFKVFRVLTLSPASFLLIYVLQMVVVSRKTGNLEPPYPLYIWDNLFNRVFISICYFSVGFCNTNALVLVLGVIFTTFQYAICTVEGMKIEIQASMTDKSKFQETLRKVVDMHCGCIEQLEKLTSVVQPLLLLFEIITYGCLLFTWIILYFLPDYAITVPGVAGVGMVYGFICYINESLDDAFEDYQQALYGIEWYNLGPGHRKMLIPGMIMAGRPTLLTVGPFHVMNFEAFKNLMNNVYSYGLIINDLVL